MRRLIMCAALLAGCTWSNSLYQAQYLSNEALRAEREKRPGDALGLWGQVVAKADSAYARAPHGKRGAEAEWLRGRARARIQDCVPAAADLEVAFVAFPDAHWREPLLLELGRCEEMLGDPNAGSIFAELTESRDTAIRREARVHAGHALVLDHRWADALTTLSGLRGTSVGVDRADALIGVGRPADALAELRPLLATHDTTIPWAHLAERLAATDARDADTLLASLRLWPKVSEERRSSWLLAALMGSLEHDPPAAARYFQELVTRPPGRSVFDARGLMATQRLMAATTVAQLASMVDSTAEIDDADNSSSLVALHAVQLRHSAQRIVGLSDSTLPGAPQGDLMLFRVAEIARDTLHSPQLAASLFLRIEREWPGSPYLPKVLFARLALEPDSADALRLRLGDYTSSPYVKRTHGIDDPRLFQLEDSLDTFVRMLAARRAAPVGETVHR